MGLERKQIYQLSNECIFYELICDYIAFSEFFILYDLLLKWVELCINCVVSKNENLTRKRLYKPQGIYLRFIS